MADSVREKRAATASAAVPRRVQLTAEEAGRLLGKSPAEIRSTVAAGTLPGARNEDGEVVVSVDLATAELPASLAARLVGVAPVTMRAWVSSGRVRARKDGRIWYVRAEDLIDRLPPELRAKVLGLASTTPRRRGPRSARPLPPATRPVYVRLSEDEYAALAAARERYGSVRECVGAALRSLASSVPFEDELARTRLTLDRTREEREAARTEAAESKRAAERFPRSVRCPGCDSWVPLSELEPAEDGGGVLVHRHHGAARLVQGTATPVARR